MKKVLKWGGIVLVALIIIVLILPDADNAEPQADS